MSGSVAVYQLAPPFALVVLQSFNPNHLAPYWFDATTSIFTCSVSCFQSAVPAQSSWSVIGVVQRFNCTILSCTWPRVRSLSQVTWSVLALSSSRLRDPKNRHPCLVPPRRRIYRALRLSVVSDVVSLCDCSLGSTRTLLPIGLAAFGIPSWTFGTLRRFPAGSFGCFFESSCEHPRPHRVGLPHPP